MALSIKDDETDALVRKLARARHLSYTAAIKLAVSNELAKDEPSIKRRNPAEALDAIADIQKRMAQLPELMTAEQFDAWMYDENGLPH